MGIFDDWKSTVPDVPDRTFGEGVKDYGVSLKQGLTTTGSDLVGLLDLTTPGDLRGWLKDTIGYSPDTMNKKYQQEKSPYQQREEQLASQGVGALGTVKSYLSHPAAIGNQAVQMVPFMAGAGALGRGVLALAPDMSVAAASGLGEGLVTAGDQESQMYQENGGPTTLAQKELSLLSGGITGLIGGIGGRTMQKLGFNDKDLFIVGGLPAMAKKVGGTPAKSMAEITKRIIGSGVGEALEEIPQTGQETIFMNAALGKPILQGVPEAMAQAGTVAAATGGAAGLVHGRAVEAKAELDKGIELVEKEDENGFQTVDDVISGTGLIESALKKARDLPDNSKPYIMPEIKDTFEQKAPEPTGPIYDLATPQLERDLLDSMVSAQQQEDVKADRNRPKGLPSGHGFEIVTPDESQALLDKQAIDSGVLGQMRNDAAGGEVGQRFKKDSGYGPNENLWDGVKSTNPDWLKNNKTLKTAGKKVIFRVMQLKEQGKSLAPRQQEIWDELQKEAKKEENENPEFAAAVEGQRIEDEEGINIKAAPEKVAVGELKKGDKVVVKRHGIPDVLEHKGDDGKGNAILKDGETIVADPFEVIDIYGKKERTLEQTTQEQQAGQEETQTEETSQEGTRVNADQTRTKAGKPGETDMAGQIPIPETNLPAGETGKPIEADSRGRVENSVTPQKSGDASTPAGPSSPGREVSKQPWDGSLPEDEDRWNTTEIFLANPKRKNDRVGKATIRRVYNGGGALEVQFDGMDNDQTFRINPRDYRSVTVTTLVDSKAKNVTNAKASGSGKEKDGRAFVPNSKEYNATVAGQKAMQHRAQRIALLIDLNNKTGNVYSKEDIESVPDDEIDVYRDELLSSYNVIKKQRDKQDAVLKEVEDKPTKADSPRVKTVTTPGGKTPGAALITRKDGSPYKTERSLRIQAKRMSIADFDVKRVDGGFVGVKKTTPDVSKHGAGLETAPAKIKVVARAKKGKTDSGGVKFSKAKQLINKEASLAHTTKVNYSRSNRKKTLRKTITGTTTATVEKEVRKVLGRRGYRNLVDKGVLRIVQGVQEVGNSYVAIKGEDGRVSAYFNPSTGQITLIADNITPEDVPGVLLHEMSHRLLATDEQFLKDKEALLDRFESLKDGNGKQAKAVREAFARAKEAEPTGNDDLIREEAMAYFLEENHKTPIFRRLVAIIKDALLRLGFKVGAIEKMTADDFVQIFKRGMKRDAGAQLANINQFAQPVMMSGQSPEWYSRLQSIITEKGPKKAGTKQWLQAIASWKKKNTIPKPVQEELEWSGLEDWLKMQDGKVGKADVVKYLKENGVEVGEVIRRAEDGTYSFYATDGEELVFSDKDEAIMRYEEEKEWIKNESVYIDDDPTEGIISVTDHEGNDVFVATKDEDGTWWRFDIFDDELVEDYYDHDAALSDAKEYAEEIRSKWLNDSPFTSEDDFDYMLNDDENKNTKFNRYTLPGGKNYQELYITLPMLKGKGFHVPPGHESGSNTADTQQVVRIRINERKDTDGNKVLFIEEVQSDAHAKGRKEGYGNSSMPNIPFKTTWQDLALKKITRYAAMNGFDKVAWISGEQTADRYDLSKQVDSVIAAKLDNGKYEVSIEKNGNLVDRKILKGQEIESYIGKDIAKKIVKHKDVNAWIETTFSGVDLKIGGEWATALYDKSLPTKANRLIKKFGSKVEVVDVNSTGKQLGFTITSKLRDSVVVNGMPLFSIAKDVKEKIVHPISESEQFNKFMQYIVDKNRSIAQIQKQLGGVKENLDLFIKETQRPKISAYLTEKFWDEHVQPFIEEAAKSKIEIGQVEELAHALHAPEANEALRNAKAKSYLDDIVNSKIDKKLKNKIADEIFKAEKQPDNLPAGYRTVLEKFLKQHGTEVEKINNSWEKYSEKPSGMTDQEATDIVKEYKGNKEAHALVNMISAINDEKLDILHDAGQISDEEYNAYKNKYEHYVPLYREGFEGEVGSGIGAGLQAPGKAIKARGGSSRGVVDIFANTVKNYETALVRAEKAKSMETLYNLVMENPDPELWHIKEEKKAPYYDSWGNLREYPTQQLNNNEIRIKVDGKPYIIEVNRDNPTAMRMLETLKAEAPSHGPIVNFLSKINRFLAAINTSYAPEFILSNFVRDLPTGLINISESNLSSWEMFKKVKQSMKTIARVEMGKNVSKEEAALYKRYKAAGGKISWMDVHDTAQDLSKKIQAEFEYASGKRPVRSTVRKWDNLWKNLNTAVENSGRFAAFKLGVENGMTDAKAAQMAADLTVDFTKKGTMSPVLNSLYIFFNASVQGNYRIIRALANSPKARKMVGGIAMIGFMAGLWNAGAGGDDLEDYLKERNLVIKIPGSKKMIKIPLPYGFNFFVNAGYEMADMVTNKDYSPLHGAARMANVLAGSFNPIQAGTLLQTLAPTVLDPFVQVGENKTWFGGDLMPAQDKYAKIKKPDSQRYWKSVSAPSKWLAGMMNDITGGNKVKSGLIDISPETLDLVTDTMGGSAFRFVKDISLMPGRALNNELPMYKIPFVRRVMSEDPEYATSKKYYKLREDLLTREAESKVYPDKFSLDRTDRRLLRVLKKTERKLSKLRKRLRLTTDKRRQELLKGRIDALQKVVVGMAG